MFTLLSFHEVIEHTFYIAKQNLQMTVFLHFHNGLGQIQSCQPGQTAVCLALLLTGSKVCFYIASSSAYNSSELNPRQIFIQGSPNTYTDTKELDIRKIENDVCAQPDNKANARTTYLFLYPLDKNDNDNTNCTLDEASDGPLKTNENCTLDEASDGQLKTNKNCTLDEASDGPLKTNKNCTLDEASDGQLKTNKNYTLDEVSDGPLKTNKNCKVGKDSDCPNICEVYKISSDNNNNILNYSASLEINNSKYFSGDPESNTSILEPEYSLQPNGSSPEAFQHNLERNRNSPREEERGRVINTSKASEGEKSHSSFKFCAPQRVSSARRGDLSSSESLLADRSNYSNLGTEPNVTKISFHTSSQPVVKEIFAGRTEHNFGSVELFNNINEIDFENSGLKSFLRFVLLLERVAIVMEEYSDYFTSKGNKKTKYEPTKFRLVVVSSQVFEDAMRQCHIETVELTYSNVFPSDCRMFICVPVYKYGYIHRKDQL